MTVTVSTLIERLSRIVHNESHAGGLKPTQWEALRYLARANRFSRSPSALTTYLGMTKGTVSQTLQALERKGLVEKATAEGDRRGVKLDVTKRGHDVLAEDPMQDLDAAIAALPEPAQESLRVHLESLVRGMIARRDGRRFGACKTCRHFRTQHEQGRPHYCSLLGEPLSPDDSERICIEQDSAA